MEIILARISLENRYLEYLWPLTKPLMMAGNIDENNKFLFASNIMGVAVKKEYSELASEFFHTDAFIGLYRLASQKVDRVINQSLDEEEPHQLAEARHFYRWGANASTQAV